MSLWGGRERLGKYQLREKLGHGGVAEVWKAFDTELHRYVAIKILHADLQTDPEFMTRFSREARFIAALHHPNIVQIYDFQTTRSLEINAPMAYMVMDYVEGETLAHYIHRTARVGQYPSPTEIVHLFASVSKAIDYAHREGMIHRDIKPANILLDKRHALPDSIGEPVLTDFGVARIMGASSDTMSGMLLGTPLYVSPEQARGDPVTKRSDIYSLGVILYEVYTGVCPFRSESVTAILMQQIGSTPPPPALFNPTIPPALTAAILCAMAKEPLERFSSASALTVAIAEALHLPVPVGLFLPARSSDDLQGPPRLGSRQPGPSSYLVPQGIQQFQPTPVMDPPLPQTPSSDLIAQQLTQSPPVKRAKLPATPTSNTPASAALPPAEQNAWATPTPPVSDVKLPSASPSLRTNRFGRSKFIAWLAVLLVLVGSTLISLMTLANGRANPPPAPPATVGTLAFTDSGQYDPGVTVGYNDTVTLSLHSLTPPQTGNAYLVWLMPEKGDDTTIPLLLGRLSVNAGNAALHYVSPAHTNLLAQYSRVRITEQQALDDSSSPSPDSKTWRWEGSLPNTPNQGDAHKYSLLSHLRHLLAKDPTLQNNQIPGGLAIWMARNMAKVQEWSGAAQGSWGSQMSDGDADLMHRHLIRMLDYLDGQAYVWQDLPSGSPWLAEPSLPGKLGLLSYTQDQDPPGYLQHVEHHLTGLADSLDHTEEQEKVAIQVHGVITKMIEDLTQVRKDAARLVQRSNGELRQPDTLTLLNEMANLTREVNSGWFDSTTHQNQGGVMWVYARIQQLATISLQVSKQQ